MTACSTLVFVVLMSACHEVSDSGYAATGTELALNQRHQGFPNLPVTRAVFEANLGRYGLRSEERSGKFMQEKPLTCPDPIGGPPGLTRRVEECLVIGGQVKNGVAERYVVFIDARGM